MTRQRHPETINSNFIQHLLTEHYSELSLGDRTILPKLKSKKNIIHPQYKKMGVYLDDRNWCLKGLGALSRQTRNTLAFQNYHDVDITNSVFSVLSHLAHKHNLDCEAIDDYCLNRKKHLKKLQLAGKTRDEAKMCFTIKPFTDYSTWHDPRKMNRLDQELCNIQNFFAKHPEHDATKRFIIKKGQTLRGDNVNGKLLSHIYFTEEWAIVEKAMDFLESKGVLPVADVHDGFYIPKDTPAGVLEELNTFIQENLGYKEISFAKKPMKDFLPGVPEEMRENYDAYDHAIQEKEYEEMKVEF